MFIYTKKELFKTKFDKLIRWYSCGPTVYDESHMGHARFVLDLLTGSSFL